MFVVVVVAVVVFLQFFSGSFCLVLSTDTRDWIGLPVKHNAIEPINRTTYQSINQSVSQSVNHSINRSINQSINQPVHQPSPGHWPTAAISCLLKSHFSRCQEDTSCTKTWSGHRVDLSNRPCRDNEQSSVHLNVRLERDGFRLPLSGQVPLPPSTVTPFRF